MILTVLAGQDMVCGDAMCSTTVYNGRQSGRILSKAPFWDTAEFVNYLCVYTRKKKKIHAKGWRCTQLNCEQPAPALP